MPAGRFTGYQPLPDRQGAYSFQTAGGPQFTFSGPEAERFKARLDAANAQNMTAENTGLPPGLRLMPESASDATTTRYIPGAESVAPFTGQPYQGKPGGAPAPAPGPAAPAQPGGALGYGLRVSPQGTIQKYQPGTRGVTREQLQAADEGAVAMRRGESDVVQQGTPQDQDYLDARAEQNIDARLAAQAEGDREIAAADEASKLAAEQFEAQKRIQAEEGARMADLQKQVAREQQLTDKAFADYSSSKVNPDRIYANPFSRIAHVLAAAGGAYAATIAKTPNFAQQIIDQQISRDIAAQEAAIKLKGEKANNLLSNLRQSGMSLEQSRAVARGIQVQYEAKQLAALRAKNTVPALQSQYDKIDLALQKSLLEANEQSRLASLDKVTRQTQKGFEQPRAGSAGGYVDVADQLGTAQKIQGLQKGEADLAKGEKPPSASPEKRQAYSAIADAADLEKKLAAYDDSDIPPAGTRGVIGSAAAGALDAVWGPGTTARNLQSEKERNMTSDFAEAQQTLGALASVLGGQGALSGAEADAFKAGMAPGGTMGEVKRAIAKLRSRAEKKMQAADAVGEAGGNIVTK